MMLKMQGKSQNQGQIWIIHILAWYIIFFHKDLKTIFSHMVDSA